MRASGGSHFVSLRETVNRSAQLINVSIPKKIAEGRKWKDNSQIGRPPGLQEAAGIVACARVAPVLAPPRETVRRFALFKIHTYSITERRVPKGGGKQPD